MKIKPYYQILAYSSSTRKLVPQYISTEISYNKKCTSLIEARRRSTEFAKSLCEANRYNVVDWVPKVQLINDMGKTLLN
jgi:hypothetical protein|tara:strand:+ start:5520 stop:5756 length:237 start_codon:yes stop_codon:yes gene_type:complete